MKNKIINSTFSNYVLLLVKIVLSLMLVRIMFLGISNEEYGFWALMWTIFGYSLLLDFGFGTAVQKATSCAMAKNDWKSYNETISTIFFSYVLLSCMILVVTVVLALNIEKIFAFTSQEDITYYQNVLYIFGIGSTLLFPFGFFKEILRGIQHITVRNNIDIVFLVLNFILLSCCVHFDYSLIHMALVAMFIQLLTNITMAHYVLDAIPSLKISLKFFRKSRIKELIGFSFFAYIVMFSNVIIFRTDQLVISIFSTVALVAVYQVVSRISELFRQFSTQIHDILGPIAASLFVTNKHDTLGSTLLKTNKIVGFISTLLLIPSVLFMDKLLYFWLKIEDPLVVNTAVVLLISMYILVFFRSSSVQVLLMCEKHKQLTLVGVIEAFANLVLSIYLIKNYSILGVAIGTLIPNLILAIVYNIPVACRFSKVSIGVYLYEVVFKTLLIGGVVLYTFMLLLEHTQVNNILELLSYSFVSVLSFSILYYAFCLTKDEKNDLKGLFRKKSDAIYYN